MMNKETGFYNNDFTAAEKKGLVLAFTPVTASPFQKNILYEKITNIFMTIGIPAHVKGYHFLREAIQLAVSNSDMLSCVTKKLYPLVASRFNTNPYIVERSIRNAIEIACNRGKMTNLNTVFGIVIFERNDKPTNSELIALLVEKLYLDHQQNRAYI